MAALGVILMQIAMDGPKALAFRSFRNRCMDGTELGKALGKPPKILISLRHSSDSCMKTSTFETAD